MSTQAIIAVGVDDTTSSRRALDWAAREAVTAWSGDPTQGTALAAVDQEVLQGLAEDTQARAIRDVLGGLARQPTVSRRLVRGTPAEALVAASRNAELVVVGTHGRGPVSSFLLGSVSLSVIKHATCPVVVMPPLREPPTDHGEPVESSP
jgi:nucleotide-binding universal stress UspA family protein